MLITGCMFQFVKWEACWHLFPTPHNQHRRDRSTPVVDWPIGSMKETEKWPIGRLGLWKRQRKRERGERVSSLFEVFCCCSASLNSDTHAPPCSREHEDEGEKSALLLFRFFCTRLQSLYLRKFIFFLLSLFVLTHNMREVLSIHIGQAGVQIG